MSKKSKDLWDHQRQRVDSRYCEQELLPAFRFLGRQWVHVSFSADVPDFVPIWFQERFPAFGLSKGKRNAKPRRSVNFLTPIRLNSDLASPYVASIRTSS